MIPEPITLKAPNIIFLYNHTDEDGFTLNYEVWFDDQMRMSTNNIDYAYGFFDACTMFFPNAEAKKIIKLRKNEISD